MTRGKYVTREPLETKLLQDITCSIIKNTTMLPLDTYIIINKIYMSDLVPIVSFWNNLHQILSQSNDLKYYLISSIIQIVQTLYIYH